MVNVYDVKIYKHEYCPNGCIRIFWEGDKGFGQYDLLIETQADEEEDDNYELKIIGDSECMDYADNKEFLKSLFMAMLDKIEVVR